MKKEKSPVLVISCILFLLMFIILPPVFRKYIPKEADDRNLNLDKLEILTCTKTSVSEMYKIISKCKYRNGIFESNTIEIEKLLEISAETNGIDAPSTITIASENANLASINGINSTVNNNLITYVIDNNLIQNNSNNEILKKYIQNLTEQKNMYESLSYTCNIMES